MEYDNLEKSEFLYMTMKHELSETISTLKNYITLLENIIENSEINQFQITKELPKSLYDDEISNDKSDAQTELWHSIPKFTNVQCINFKQNSRFIFEIHNIENNVKNDLYTMEILIDSNGYGKLKKYVLPDSVNVHEMLWQYPINNLNDIKLFLKNCKQGIDCYFNRLQQVNDLKNIFSKIQNGYVYHNKNITLVKLTMDNVKDIYTYNNYDIIIYLYYHLNETRPYKLYVNSKNMKIISLLLNMRLRMYFKPFLRKDLCLAFMQIINSYTGFIWQKVILTNKDNIEVYVYEENVEENEEDEGYVDIFLCRRDRSPNINEIEI